MTGSRCHPCGELSQEICRHRSFKPQLRARHTTLAGSTVRTKPLLLLVTQLRIHCYTANTMELCSSDEDDYSYADFDLSPDEGQVSDDGDDAVQDQCTWWSPAFPVEYQSFFAMCRVRAPCPCARLVAAIQSGSMGRSMKHMRMLTQQTCTLSLVRAHAARAIMEIPGALGAMTELLAKALNPDLPPVRSASMHYTSFCTFLTLGNTLSPLVMAVRCGHAGVVTTLLEHGADPTQFISQESRWRPVDAVNVLNHALSRGHFDVARTLLQHGADPNNFLTEDRTLMPPLIRH